MEITNENFFNVKYNSELNRLEMRKKNRFIEAIRKHKIISLAFISLIMFSCLNFFLIYNFMKILQNI